MYSDVELREKLSRLLWLSHRSNMHKGGMHGLLGDQTRGQGRVIAILKMQNEISTKDLSYLLGIRIQSLNELLAKLEKNGYIVRDQNESDRRIIMIRLTQKGKDIEKKEVERDQIFDCLTDGEKVMFGECIDKISDSLAQRIDNDAIYKDFDMEAMRTRLGDKFDKMFAFNHMGNRFHNAFGRFGGFHNEDCQNCKKEDQNNVDLDEDTNK